MPFFESKPRSSADYRRPDSRSLLLRSRPTDCIDQDNIPEGLMCLPVYLAFCNSLLVLAGSTYRWRLWCVMELFIFLLMGGSESAVDLRLLYDSQDAAKRDEVSSGEEIRTFRSCIDGIICFYELVWIEILNLPFVNLSTNQAGSGPRGFRRQRGHLFYTGRQGQDAGSHRGGVRELGRLQRGRGPHPPEN